MSTLKEDTSLYLKKHKIPELITHLSEMVFFFKPEDPVEFMKDVILDMKRASDNGYPLPSLYTEDSLRAYFRLLDPAGAGMITWKQMKSAFDVLGLKDVKIPDLQEMPVFEDIFVEMGMKCVRERLNISHTDDL